MSEASISKYSIPLQLNQKIEKTLQSLGSSQNNSAQLAQAVLKLSDYFIQNPEAKTPWNAPGTPLAYLSYYTPLNYLRALRAIEKAQQQNFFEGLDHIIEFGTGLGSASLALETLHSWRKFDFIEVSEIARKIHQTLVEMPDLKSWHGIYSNRIQPSAKSMAVFSYSFTELAELPEWALQCEALFIMEPSTQQDGRRLMQLRGELLKKGFHIWAPCTHHESCPLLNESKTDWCHDRLLIEKNDWMQKIEQHLPMKNRTLTVSYLIARKKPAPTKEKSNARIVGDQLDEKGKVRQMICRGPHREYLAWLKKVGPAPALSRGDLFQIPTEFEIKGNEIRLKN